MASSEVFPEWQCIYNGKHLIDSEKYNKLSDLYNAEYPELENIKMTTFLVFLIMSNFVRRA